MVGILYITDIRGFKKKKKGPWKISLVVAQFGYVCSCMHLYKIAYFSTHADTLTGILVSALDPSPDSVKPSQSYFFEALLFLDCWESSTGNQYLAFIFPLHGNISYGVPLKGSRSMSH